MKEHPMIRTTKLALIAALLSAPCFPQATENKAEEPAKYFRPDFTVKELDGGKVVNARTYSTSLSNQKGDSGSMRTGDRVPVQSKDQWTYLNVGVNIDCNSLKEIGSQLAIHVTADVSNFSSEAQVPGANPLIRQNRWSSTVLVPLKKPMIIFSSDGASTKRQTQLELTATPIP
jgi:hypothetical protein